MKNFIEYYYNLNDIYLIKKKYKYIFKYNNNSYEFLPLIRDPEEINEIYELLYGKEEYDQIIRNTLNQLVTNYYGRSFILIKKQNKVSNMIELLTRMNNNSLWINRKYKIDRSDWPSLWSKKVDNIEYQLSHIVNKFPLLSESIHYYIGLAENAISYINNYFQGNRVEDRHVISHMRIKEDDFNSPQNIIIDYQSRDIAEYIKYIFFHKKYSYEEIKTILLQCNLHGISYELLYGRLLFPTFYFDMYDRVINSDIEDDAIASIINRTEEYEQYLLNIFYMINDIKKIPKVNWL